VVTGGAGFIGSHVAEFYAKKHEEVVVFDNLSRATLLNNVLIDPLYNWNYLKRYNNIHLVKGDVRDKKKLEKIAKNADVIVHTAAQTAVTTSLLDPTTDFEINTVGTFNVVEAARKNDSAVVFTSTNKVYGANVNKILIKKKKSRYVFADPNFNFGIPETLPIDLTEHSPYGSSKLAADIYVQEYAHTYGIKSGVFRMSCIYGDRQFGVEDQGWVAWFTIATLTNKQITIYGDGMQVRDVLYVDDLVNLFDRFIRSNKKHVVVNTGGGPKNTLSLIELLNMLAKLTGKRVKVKYSAWRPADQKVYISDITAAKKLFNWGPTITPQEGIKLLLKWAKSIEFNCVK
jgi:CDP-paratose 2-epimerase